MVQVKKKILVVDSSAGIGGGQRIAFDICSSLRDRFEFIVTSPKGVYNEKYSAIKIKIRILSGVFPIKQIRRIIIEEKPDIIHAHGTRAAVWSRAAILLTERKTALIYTLHGLHIAKRKGVSKAVLLIIERILNRWTDVLVCVSQADKDEVLGYRLIDPKKVVVIRNGIDIDAFKADEDSIRCLRAKEGLKDKIVLTGIGRLHPPKDFSTLLKAASILAKEGMDLVLLIAGDGLLRRALEEETETLGLKDRVRFLGFREDVAGIIASSDIVVLSSNWEAFGLVCIEAGAAKKPIIASDIEGIKEAVVNGVTGYLFRKGDPKDLAEKILLLTAPKKRAVMGLAGYEYVTKNFDVARMAKDYGRLYDSLIAGSKGGDL